MKISILNLRAVLFGRHFAHEFRFPSRHCFCAYQGCVNVVSFSKNGDLIVTGSDDGDVRVWNAHSRECIRTLSFVP